MDENGFEVAMHLIQAVESDLTRDLVSLRLLDIDSKQWEHILFVTIKNNTLNLTFNTMIAIQNVQIIKVHGGILVYGESRSACTSKKASRS